MSDERCELQATLPALDLMVTDNTILGDAGDGASARPFYGDGVAAMFRVAAEDVITFGDISQRFADVGWRVDVCDGILTLTAPEHLTPTEAMPMARELAAPMEDAFSWASPSAMRGHALNADTSTSHE